MTSLHVINTSSETIMFPNDHLLASIHHAKMSKCHKDSMICSVLTAALIPSGTFLPVRCVFTHAVKPRGDKGTCSLLFTPTTTFN